MKTKLMIAAVVAVILFGAWSEWRDRASSQWYAQHCFPPTHDAHGAVTNAGGDQWPCSQDNPLP